MLQTRNSVLCMRVKFITFGCKVNQYETQALVEEFSRHGFVPTLTGDADLYVINTCSVTARADKKAREAVRAIKKENPNAKIAVTGCMAQLNGDKVKKWGVDWVVGQDKKADIIKIIFGNGGPQSPLRHFLARASVAGPRWGQSPVKNIWSLAISDFFIHRAFVKVQDGCDNRCSFCKIPYIRGASQSRFHKDILDEVRRLSEKYYEIVLCGVNLGLYGRDLVRFETNGVYRRERDTQRTRNQISLAQLVEKTLAIKTLGRLRLSSLESIFAGDDLLEFLNHPKFCPHLHIPFQSGDDKVLKAMNKRETVKGYLEFVEKARRINPDVAISADFIVGFPAEGEEEFKNTLEFLREVKPMRTHLFTFSPREHTPFEGVKIKDKALIKKRFDLLQETVDQCALDYARKFIGRKMEIITEERKGDMVYGYTPNYLHVGVNKNLTPGSVVSVVVDSVKNNIIHTVPA